MVALGGYTLLPTPSHRRRHGFPTIQLSGSLPAFLPVSCTQVACEINFSTICSVLETDFWVSSDGVVYILEIFFGFCFIYIFSGQKTVSLGMRGT